MLSTVKTENLRRAVLRGALLCLLPLLALTAARLPACAAINQTFNYQGYLLSKATNLPVETPQYMKFIIYNAATGGTALFTESRCPIGVTKGRYDVEIGSMTSGGIPTTVFLSTWGATVNQNLWLEVQVSPGGSCGGAYEAMTPRMRLQASPFAFNSLYASTASAATTVFAADTIGALPTTTNGAITISSNLFVMGGISVGSISPGQKLAVAGIVESSTGGFKFPDGSIQVEAAAVTMWKVSGANVYSINPGNVGIGENLTSPLARLHVSTAAGDTGDLFLVTAGAVEKFRVNGLGEVFGGSYYGNGSNLGGVVKQAGDVMTGPLTLLSGSSLTVTSSLGAEIPKVTLGNNIVLSSAAPANYGGIYISSNVYLPSGARYYGDGGGLTNLFTLDQTKVYKGGDVMTGQLTLGYSTNTMSGSTLTVTGNAFSVTGSTFAVYGGSVAIGSLTSFPTRLSVVGGILATSSITAQAGLYSTTLASAPYGFFSTNVTASSGTFRAVGQYSLETASGVFVGSGPVIAQYFVGSGALLDGVLKSTDTSKVSKLGDVMTGNLQVRGSSVTIASYGAYPYALTIGSATYMSTPYYLAVTTGGNVGVQVDAPSVPLEVRKTALISSTDGNTANLGLYTSASSGYINWRDNILNNSYAQGALGFFGGQRNFIYRANGLDVSGTTGSEVFRIAADDDSVPYWKFGIGTALVGLNNDMPLERFHVATNMLVSTAAINPILFVSTSTGRVSIRTLTGTHAFTVNGGINAVSSITAQGGFFGNGAGLTNISTGAIPNEIKVATITAMPGSAYDAVVFTTNVYINSKLAVGGVFTPDADAHIRGTTQLSAQAGGNVVLKFFPDPQFSGDAYIQWYDSLKLAKGVLGVEASFNDLVYRGGATNMSDGVQVFRIKPDGKFLIGDASTGFTATERFQVMTNMMVSKSDVAGSIIYVSTGLSSVGFSTGTPKERVHVASSFLVGADRASAALFVSTATGFTGIGTGSPSSLLDVNGNILGSGGYTGTAAPPVSGGSTARFMWVPTAAALRAGGVATTEWDAGSIGNYSIGFGYNPKVTASYASVLGGTNNTVRNSKSVITGGENNLVTGLNSGIAGGAYNTVHSSYSFAGGYNNYLDINSSGTFVWSYDDAYNAGFNGLHIGTPFSFLIDPANTKHYTVGIRTDSPQAALDVNGDAKFGATGTKTSFTSEGFWVPRILTNADLAGAPTVIGAVVYNSDKNDLCVATSLVAGGWKVVGSNGALACY